MRSFVLAVLLASSTAQAAPPPPRGGHPRLFLSQGTLDLMKSKLGDSTSGAARVVAKCKDAAARPQNFNRNDEWEWAIGASSCALAYRLTGDTAHVAPGTRLLNALLDDYEAIGDGAGGDEVVRHDTGFWLRIHAPYVAMAYDWMHDQLSDSVTGTSRTRRARTTTRATPSRRRSSAWPWPVRTARPTATSPTRTTRSTRA
jgi:hypothetical protein